MKYKWFFDESGVLTECEPKLDNDTKLEFAPETNEMFYRAKLSGALTFQNEFDAILAKNFGYTHIVVLKRYSDTENDYVEVWRGKFTLTDCTINYDRKTIEVTPKTIDRYTDVIAALETDYNIVKLAPQMHPVNINIRPCLQVYCYNSSKISNYIGHNAWEADCTASTGADVETGPWCDDGIVRRVRADWHRFCCAAPPGDEGYTGSLHRIFLPPVITRTV